MCGSSRRVSAEAAAAQDCPHSRTTLKITIVGCKAGCFALGSPRPGWPHTASQNQQCPSPPTWRRESQSGVGVARCAAAAARQHQGTPGANGHQRLVVEGEADASVLERGSIRGRVLVAHHALLACRQGLQGAELARLAALQDGGLPRLDGGGAGLVSRVVKGVLLGRLSAIADANICGCRQVVIAHVAPGRLDLEERVGGERRPGQGCRQPATLW